MAIVIKAHYDGKTFVPDEPVDLPADTPVSVEPAVTAPEAKAAEIARRRAALRRFAALVANDPEIPLEATRRENMYEPPRGL